MTLCLQLLYTHVSAICRFSKTSCIVSLMCSWSFSQLPLKKLQKCSKVVRTTSDIFKSFQKSSENQKYTESSGTLSETQVMTRCMHVTWMFWRYKASVSPRLFFSHLLWKEPTFKQTLDTQFPSDLSTLNGISHFPS